MVESCSAINCSAKREKGVKLKFLSIPKDPARRKQWLLALRRENFNPGNRAVICENHFTKDDFEFNVHGNRVLKITALPSVFNFPSHLKKEVKVRRPLKRKLTCTEPSPSNTDLETSTLEVHVDGSLPLIEGSSAGNIHESPSLCVLKIVSKRRCRDPIFFGDFRETDLENEIKRKRFWKAAHETVSKYKKLNKYYQCVIRRQKIKIKSLNSLVDDLTK